MAFRDKLLKCNLERYGSRVSKTELPYGLIPETISETDLREFNRDCTEFEIEQDALPGEGIAPERHFSATDGMTLREFATRKAEKIQIVIKDDALSYNRTCQSIKIKPFRKSF